jgi:hypothetical protein
MGANLIDSGYRIDGAMHGHWYPNYSQGFSVPDLHGCFKKP